MNKLLLPIFALLLLSSCISLENHLSNINAEYAADSQYLSDDWGLVHYTAAFGSQREMEAVLRDGANGDTPDSRGNTPAAIAVLHNNFETFKVLVDWGCDLSIMNNIGGSAVSYIGYFSPENMKRAFSLLGNGNDLLNYRSPDGMTLAHLASYGLNRDMMALLLEAGMKIDGQEDLTGLKPIDFTQLTTYKYTDLFPITENDYLREEQFVNWLISNGSPALAELPMSLAIYGNFLFVIYASVNSLFPYQVDLGYVNRGEYFSVESINNRQCISLNQNEIEQMFRDFYFNIEIEVVEKDFKEKIQECADSDDLYILFADFGNHPYMAQHWANVNRVYESGGYADYLDVMNPNKLFDGQYFRIGDISHLIAIKLREIPEEVR